MITMSAQMSAIRQVAIGGRVTIPREIRSTLCISVGDYVRIVVEKVKRVDEEVDD